MIEIHGYFYVLNKTKQKQKQFDCNKMAESALHQSAMCVRTYNFIWNSIRLVCLSCNIHTETLLCEIYELLFVKRTGHFSTTFPNILKSILMYISQTLLTWAYISRRFSFSLSLSRLALTPEFLYKICPPEKPNRISNLQSISNKLLLTDNV